MDKAEAVKVASEIAVAIGEVADRPRAQIARIVMLMGEEWGRGQLGIALHRWKSGDFLGPAGYYVDNGISRQRTLGGFFFEVCRRGARDHVKPGGITRREFFRCFYDRAPEPKQPKTPPPKKARMPRPDPMAAARRVRERRAVQPEIYTVRRAAR